MLIFLVVSIATVFTILALALSTVPGILAVAYLAQYLPRLEPHYGDPASPINAAAARGDVAEMKRLVFKSAAAANRYEGYPRTAVMVASQAGQIEVLRTIVTEENWNVNNKIFARNPKSAIDFAAHNGQIDAVLWLLQHGARLHTTKELGEQSLLAVLADERSNDARKRAGLVRVAKLYIDQGEDVNKQLYSSNMTPLHLAVRESFPQMVQLLLESGANPHLQDRDGKSALDVAVSANCEECVGLLKNARRKP